MPTIDELAAKLNVLVPIGTVVAYAGEVQDTNGIVEAPVGSGWLLCNGAAVSSDGEFRQLFLAIGAAHGNGQENRTSPLPLPDFNLPDFRGLFLRGVHGGRSGPSGDPDNMSRTANLRGGNEGNFVGSFQPGQNARHSHTIQGVHLQAEDGDGFSGSGMRSNSSNRNPEFDRVFATSTEGGEETRPINAYVHWIIKARP